MFNINRNLFASIMAALIAVPVYCFAADVAPVRGTVGRANVSRAATQTTNRGVAARAGTMRPTSARAATATRGTAVRGTSARSATNVNSARVGVVASTGARASSSAARAVTTASVTTSVIDSTTGLISNEAYNNCQTGYYTCMDEICTARAPGKKRCACSNRVKEYVQIENSLEKAKEDLLKVSHELSMLIATGGDQEKIEAAFRQTGGEEMLGCYNGTKKDGCPTDSLNGADSDILISLKTIADSVSSTDSIISDDGSNLYISANALLEQLGSTSGLFDAQTSNTDPLRDLWGTDLLNWGYTNICKRVQDMCFNGIANTAPADLTTDPYANLRAPVTQARKAIYDRYSFAANADCDVYGEELKKQVQNINYQKIAAEQLLQKKRLEFANTKATTSNAAAATAQANYNKCESEIVSCYSEQQEISANRVAAGMPKLASATVRSLCKTVAKAPSCYEKMENNNVSIATTDRINMIETGNYLDL